MKRVISVECWADKYFVWKLMQNEQLVNKEENKESVFKYIIERRKKDFCIGIVDKDKKEVELYLEKSLKRSLDKVEVDYKIEVLDYIDIVKLKNSKAFLLQLGPIKFEHWINGALKEKEKKFEWLNSVVDLENFFKGLEREIIKNDNFKELMNFIFKESIEDENGRVFLLRKVLNFLINENQSATKAQIQELIY